VTSRNGSPSPRDRRSSSSRDSRTSRDQRSSSSREERSADDARGQGRRANGGSPSPVVLARRASADLAELLGRDPEAITSLERTDDGWRVGVEILEIRRIPDTADVLAEYEVEADEEGHLTAYRRARRYTRGHVDDDR
jgi:hypothetical protein